MSNFSHVFMWQMYPESELCFKKWKDIFYNDEIKQWEDSVLKLQAEKVIDSIYNSRH